MTLDQLLRSWQGGLIVSCQAPAGSPLARPDIIAALARTAELHGAVGVRVDSPACVRAVRDAVALPVVGLYKQLHPGSEVRITPTFEACQAVAHSGASMLAIDATGRPRPGRVDFRSIVARVHGELELPVMADVATFADGVRAVEEDGADVVATTLAGYTAGTSGLDGPDFGLVERLAGRLSVPVVCEGRLRAPDDVRRAFGCGAFTVVVGNAITGVAWLVQQFVSATPRHARKGSAD